MKHVSATVLPHLLVQLLMVLLASGGAILYTISELPGLVLLGLFILFQFATYGIIRCVGSMVIAGQELWLRVVQQVIFSVFVVMLLTILAVLFWLAFEFSIWQLSGNGMAGYTFYLEHVVVSVVPQVVEVLLLGEVLRQVWVWLLVRQWANSSFSTSD